MTSTSHTATRTPAAVVASVNALTYRGFDEYRGPFDDEGFVYRLAGQALPTDAVPVAVVDVAGAVTILDGCTELPEDLIERIVAELGSETEKDAAYLYWEVVNLYKDLGLIYTRTRRLAHLVAGRSAESLAAQVRRWEGKEGLPGRIFASASSDVEDPKLPSWARALAGKTHGLI